MHPTNRLNELNMPDHDLTTPRGREVRFRGIENAGKLARTAGAVQRADPVHPFIWMWSYGEFRIFASWLPWGPSKLLAVSIEHPTRRPARATVLDIAGAFYPSDVTVVEFLDRADRDQAARTVTIVQSLFPLGGAA